MDYFLYKVILVQKFFFPFFLIWGRLFSDHCNMHQSLSSVVLWFTWYINFNTSKRCRILKFFYKKVTFFPNCPFRAEVLRLNPPRSWACAYVDVLCSSYSIITIKIVRRKFITLWICFTRKYYSWLNTLRCTDLPPITKKACIYPKIHHKYWKSWVSFTLSHGCLRMENFVLFGRLSLQGDLCGCRTRERGRYLVLRGECCCLLKIDVCWMLLLVKNWFVFNVAAW